MLSFETIFLVGTVVASVAGSFPVLLIARLIQAIGAGVLSGMSMTILFSVYGPEERSVPTTLMGLVFGLAPAIGPTLGGWLVDGWGWQSIFYVMIPVTIITLIMILIFMADVVPHRIVPLDWLSVILSMVGFGGILYGASNIGDHGWLATISFWPMVLGVLIVVAFLFRQSRIANPILQIKVFAKGNFALASVISAIAQISMVAVEFILPIYLQTIRGLTALQSGLALLPGAIVMFVMSPVAGYLLGKGRGKQIIILGVATMTLSTLALSFITVSTATWIIVALYALRNVGLALAMMPSGTLGMQSLTPDLISHGSAGNNMVRQIGASIGTALLVSVMQNVSDNAAPSTALLRTNPHAYVTQVHQAFMTGTHAALLVATGIGVVGIIAGLFLKTEAKPKQAPVAEPAKN